MTRVKKDKKVKLMDIEELKELYAVKQQEYGVDAYRHISELLNEAKAIHKEAWEKENPNGNHGQSWNAIKGHRLELLIRHIIAEQIQLLGLKIIEGRELIKQTIKLTNELQQAKRNLVIDYGEFGMHLPDADLIIYNPENYQDIIIVSIKSTMRDRVAQTGYWKLKLMQSPLTEKTLVYFITLDEDGDLNRTKSYRKPRAIVEVDTDSCYVLTENTIEISDNVKTFDRFINDVEIWLSERKSDIQSS